MQVETSSFGGELFSTSAINDDGAIVRVVGPVVDVTRHGPVPSILALTVGDVLPLVTSAFARLGLSFEVVLFIFKNRYVVNRWSSA